MSCGVGHRCGSGLMLLRLWHRPAATALIRPLSLRTSICHGCYPPTPKKNEWISNEFLLYSTENYIQSLGIEHDGRQYEKQKCIYVCVCIWLGRYAVQQKLAQHCKSTTLKKKDSYIKKKKNWRVNKTLFGVHFLISEAGLISVFFCAHIRDASLGNLAFTHEYDFNHAWIEW